jgi:hypothetical protein
LGKIHIDQVKAGITLADDVKHRNGRLLLRAGTTLEENHLVILRTWGIREIDAAGIEEKEKNSQPHLPPAITPQRLAAAKEELKPLFCHAGTAHPVMRELLRLAAIRKVSHG